MSDKPVPVPAPAPVRALLADLFGRKVEVSPGDLVVAKPGAPVSVAVYVTDKTAAGALLVCDLAFAAHAGAALGLLPPAHAAEAVKKGALPEALAENYYEVANIASSLFITDDTPHLKLYKVHGFGDAVPTDLVGYPAWKARSVSLNVSVGGYGDGRVSLLALL